MALGKSSLMLISNRIMLAEKAIKFKSGGYLSRRGRLTIWLALFIVAGLLIWSWLQAAITTITANWPILVALILLTTLNLFIRWLRWHFLIRCINFCLPIRNSLKLYLLTLPTLMTPLYLGELLRAAWLSTRFPKAWIALSKVWLIERLSDAFVLGLFLLAPRLHWGMMLALATPLVLLTLTPGSVKSRPAQTVIAPAVWGATVMASLATWLLSGLGLWLLLPGLHLPITNLIWLNLEPSGLSLAVQAHFQDMNTALTSSTATLLWIGTSGVLLILGLLAVTRWYGQLTALLAPPQPIRHFKAIAPHYCQEIPAHIRDRLIPRKIAAMQRVLQSSKLPPNAHGLDLGCGPGWYASQMARLGYRVSACDLVPGQASAARRYALAEQSSIAPQVAAAGMLPYSDNSFDFIYSINLIHHLASPEAQQQSVAEIVRVLKPGGIFFLQEINTCNPLFAFYMNYIFPLLRNIDDGTEQWLKPSALPQANSARWSEDITYFTFLPDFTPQRLLPLLTGLEQFLETFIPHWSAHYVACLVKEGSQ